MRFLLDQVLVPVLIVAALVYLILRSKKGKDTCSSGCGCATTKKKY
jgi:hypothetical protein